jgi:hypothetical protein
MWQFVKKNIIEIGILICGAIVILAMVDIISWSEATGYVGIVMIPCMVVITVRMRKGRKD